MFGWPVNGYRPVLGGQNGSYFKSFFLPVSSTADHLRFNLRRLFAPSVILLCTLAGLILIHQSLSESNQSNVRAIFNWKWNRKPYGQGLPGIWPSRHGFHGNFFGSGDVFGNTPIVAIREEVWGPLEGEIWIGDGGFGATDQDGRCTFRSPLSVLPAEELEIVKNLLSRNQSYAQGGFLQSDPETAHPIYQLLFKGEKRWKEMLRNRSETLEDAVREYKRRYGRNPPRGFDHWWDFAKEKNILLPDEYDTINESLAPFWGFSLKERRARQREAEQLGWTFTLVKHEDGGISSDYVSGHNQFDEWNSAVYGWRSADHIKMIDIMKHLLPVGYRWSMGIADRAAITPSWDETNALIQAGKEGKELDIEDPDKLSRDDWIYPQWAEACPRTSPLRQGFVEGTTPSFATNIRDSGDVCQHPLVFDEHGLFLEPRGPESFPVPHSRLLPIGTLCKADLQGDILTSFTEYGPWNGGWDGVNDDFFDTTAWEDKQPKLFWEGHYTDFDVDRKKGSGRWRHSQRARLHKLGNPTLDYEEPLILADSNTGKPYIEDYSIMAMSDAYYELLTTPNGHGGSAQCQRLTDDGTCIEQEDIFGINKGGHDGEEYRRYLYLMDVDGNGWSARFLKLMSSHGLVFKSTAYPEWNRAMLPEWFGFVPIKIDYSDLASVMAFFEGPPDSPDTRRRLVAKIMADNGRCWADRTWRIEDVQAYMYRLHLEYARLQNSDKPDFDFILPSEDNSSKDNSSEEHSSDDSIPTA